MRTAPIGERSLWDGRSLQVTWRLCEVSTRFGRGGVVGCRLDMKVYTRTGGDGTTGLLFGGRVGKDDVGRPRSGGGGKGGDA